MRTYKNTIRKVADKSESPHQAVGYKSAWRIPSQNAVCYIIDPRRIFIPHTLTMLNKMYLSWREVFQKYKLTATKKLPSNINRRNKLPPQQSDYDKWIKMSENLREEDVIHKVQLNVLEKRSYRNHSSEI